MADELLLVKPFMPVGGQCLLYGKRGLGKTQLAHTLAIDVALGQPFLGMFETVQCNVVYVQADIPPALQKDRYSRIVKHLSLDKQFPLWYLISPGSFDTLDAIGNEANWIEDLRAVSPGLVIIDTLRKAHRMDENLSSTVVDVYAAWRYICGPDATILYIHHDRKSFDGGESAYRALAVKALSCISHPRRRYIFAEHALRDRTFKAIGRDMGISHQRAHQMFKEARAMVRERLKSA